MATMNFLKKMACLMIVFLCILFIGSASVLLGGQPAETNYSPTRSGKIERPPPPRASRPTPPNLSRKVTVSWYGAKHHKKLTASGQRFNMHKNTLAHRTLPFGTKVRLVNMDNGKSAEGVVNDRGPYIKGREIDLSYALAKQLGFIQKGIVNLYLEKI